MTTQYAEEQGFKKKYLAPLIVLMLCAVSLTGAAYAYSTSVTGNGDIQGDYYSIDMYDTTGTVIKENIKSGTVGGDFDVETAKTVGNNYTAKTVNADGKYENITITYLIKTTVQSSQKSETCTISGEAKYANQDKTGAFYSSWATGASCVVSFATAADGEYTDNSITGATETMYFVKVTVTLPALSDTLTSADPKDIPTLLNFNGTGCLTITLKATNA